MSDLRDFIEYWPSWLGRLVMGVCALGAVFAVASVAKTPGMSSQRTATNWQMVFHEAFEDGLGDGWTAIGGEYTWGATEAFVSSSPSHSAWCVGGGDQDDALVAGTDAYPNNVDSWLVYGPVYLTDALDGRFRFNWWLDTPAVTSGEGESASLQMLPRDAGMPEEGDWFGWCILTEENNLDGTRCTYVSGSTGTWVSGAVPLDDYLPGNGGSGDGIWIAFRFVSDDSPGNGWGAFVDDVTVEIRRQDRVFLPLVRRDPTPTSTPRPPASPTPDSTPAPTELQNGGFEADWSEEESHRVLIFPTDGEPHYEEMSNVFTPPSWLTWYLHGMPVDHDPSNADGWVQPEVNDAWLSHDPVRVHSGQKGIHMFKTYGIFDGGFLQEIDVEADARLRLSAWAHAWSNSDGGLHPGDPRWSEGAGYDCGFKLEEDTLDSDWRNFTFMVGIDPTGGRDPYAGTVVWGWGAHIYNCYAEVPSVEVPAQSSTVTVFLRSRVLWAFRDNNAYWDDVTLEVIP